MSNGLEFSLTYTIEKCTSEVNVAVYPFVSVNTPAVFRATGGLYCRAPFDTGAEACVDFELDPVRLGRRCSVSKGATADAAAFAQVQSIGSIGWYSTEPTDGSTYGPVTTNPCSRRRISASRSSRHRLLFAKTCWRVASTVAPVAIGENQWNRSPQNGFVVEIFRSSGWRHAFRQR